MFQLETYKGERSRHTCPACGSRRALVRYVGSSGNYIDDSVGRCNRESKCGYHRTPKEHFAAFGGKPDSYQSRRAKCGSQTKSAPINQWSAPDFISDEAFNRTQIKKSSAFTDFLFELFPDCAAELRRVLLAYRVGAFDGFTCFPSIDGENRICRAKLIRFDRNSCKRLKGDFDTSSLVKKLKLKNDFNYKQIFFGEHLLTMQPTAPVAIVEAEKTAIIAVLCFPSLIWLATGSKQWLKAERIAALGNRKIILYPDADGFDQWQAVAAKTRALFGRIVEISNLIEKAATAAEKAEGYDLADYLIAEQIAVNEHNVFADKYNSALEKLLANEILKGKFEQVFNEQKSNLMLYGNLPAREAEEKVSQPENVRKIVFDVAGEM